MYSNLNKSIMKTSYDGHLNVYMSTMNWIIFSLKSSYKKNYLNLFMLL